MLCVCVCGWPEALPLLLQVEGKQVSSIGPGLLVLAGLKAGDSQAEMQAMARRVLNCRLWTNAEGRAWDQSVRPGMSVDVRWHTH